MARSRHVRVRFHFCGLGARASPASHQLQQGLLPPTPHYTHITHTQRAHALHQQALELLLIAYDELWSLVMAVVDCARRQLQRGVDGELAERRYSSSHSCNNTYDTCIRLTRSMLDA